MGKVIYHNFREERDELDERITRLAKHLLPLLEKCLSDIEPEPDPKNYKGVDWSEIG